MNRSMDWWQQAQRDERHARHSIASQDYEWAAFAAQQAAEKGLKALILNLGGEPWGHSVTALVDSLPEGKLAPGEIGEAARRLDKLYIPTRYPNGLAAGYPGNLYTQGEAEGALNDATAILAFCRSHLPR